MRRIDGYLSRLAQKYWPTALVLVLTDQGEAWVLRRDGEEDLGLGDNYHLAEQGVRALVRSEEARRGKTQN